MIYKETILKNVDNSGVTWSKCIHIKGTCNKKIANLGDIILISTFRIRSKKKIKKKKYVGLIVGAKNYTARLDGSFIKFFKNNVILLLEQEKLMGTRVYGPLPRELYSNIKLGKYKKMVTYSWTV